MFRTVPLSIIRSYSLYTQQWYMSYRFVDSFRAGSGWNSSSILILLESWSRSVPILCNSKIHFFQNKSPPLRPRVNAHTLSLRLFDSPTSFPTASSILYSSRRPTWHPLLFVLSFKESAALGFTCQALFPTLIVIIFHFLLTYFNFILNFTFIF
jgi:hypothetical protein